MKYLESSLNFRWFNKFIYFLILPGLTACGGGDSNTNASNGGISTCDKALTVDYVNNEFLTKDEFVLGNYTASNTTLIHEDGNQGNSFDIDRIIMSRTTHTSGNSLALSYSLYAKTKPAVNTFVALYIDMDNNKATGKAIGNLGAEVLILSGAELFDIFSQQYVRLHIWSSSQWIAAPTLGSYAGSASYYQGCTSSIAINAPLYSGLDALYGMNVRGVMQMVTLSNNDPNTPTGIIDTTTEFDFMVP